MSDTPDRKLRSLDSFVDVVFIALRYAIRANLTQADPNASAEQFTRADGQQPLAVIAPARLLAGRRRAHSAN